MCENLEEVKFRSFIDAIWDNNGEEIGLFLSLISLNPQMKENVIRRASSLSDKRITRRILKLVN